MLYPANTDFARTPSPTHVHPEHLGPHGYQETLDLGNFTVQCQSWRRDLIKRVETTCCLHNGVQQRIGDGYPVPVLAFSPGLVPCNVVKSRPPESNGDCQLQTSRASARRQLFLGLLKRIVCFRTIIQQCLAYDGELLWGGDLLDGAISGLAIEQTANCG
jgi:hypothetical protein